jgi:hypothetical protein
MSTLIANNNYQGNVLRTRPDGSTDQSRTVSLENQELDYQNHCEPEEPDPVLENWTVLFFIRKVFTCLSPSTYIQDKLA